MTSHTTCCAGNYCIIALQMPWCASSSFKDTAQSGVSHGSVGGRVRRECYSVKADLSLIMLNPSAMLVAFGRSKIGISVTSGAIARFNVSNGFNCLV